jgi:hypothetical protein
MTRLTHDMQFNLLVYTLHPKVWRVYWHCAPFFRLYDSCQGSELPD